MLPIEWKIRRLPPSAATLTFLHFVCPPLPMRTARKFPPIFRETVTGLGGSWTSPSSGHKSLKVNDLSILLSMPKSYTVNGLMFLRNGQPSLAPLVHDQVTYKDYNVRCWWKPTPRLEWGCSLTLPSLHPVAQAAQVLRVEVGNLFLWALLLAPTATNLFPRKNIVLALPLFFTIAADTVARLFIIQGGP